MAYRLWNFKTSNFITSAYPVMRDVLEWALDQPRDQPITRASIVPITVPEDMYA